MAQPRSSNGPSGGSGKSILLAVGGAAVVIAAAFVAMSVFGGGDDKPASSTPPATASSGGAGTGAAAPPAAPVQAAGVEVAQQTIDLGRVPLDKTVDPSFTLKNVGSARASLGKAKIETLEGC